MATLVAIMVPGSATATVGLLSSQTGVGGAPIDVTAANEVVALNPNGPGTPRGVVIYDAAGHPVGGFGDNGPDPPDPWTDALDLAVGPTGNVWIADTHHDQILEFSRAGALLTRFGSTGVAGGQFRYPIGVALDDAGNVYVADSLNDRIQKFSPSGALLALWGSRGSGPGRFAHPTGVDVGSGGDVFVTDAYNGRIQEFSTSGELIRILGRYPPDPGGDPPAPWPIAAADDGSVFAAAMFRYSDWNGWARVAPTGELQETFGCPVVGTNTGIATHGSEFVAGYPGQPPGTHQEAIPPTLERYGSGGTSWTEICPQPTVRLRGPARQRATKLRVKAACPYADCTVTVRGVIERRRGGSKLGRIALRKASASLREGDVKRIHLRAVKRHRLERLGDRSRAGRRRWHADVSGFAEFEGSKIAKDEFTIAIK